ncbi:MAG: hypothetical protein LBT80_03995 [Lactobacillaceae bacterium]|jgi:hypothetical protein|nr:hypothetical protein [Lactobacillaceae bacterium]
MSMIAGTIIYVVDDKTYFLVADESADSSFFAVKMHRHDTDTALGSILHGLKADLGIDPNNLRLGELAAWHTKRGDTAEDLISLYTFTVVDPSLLNHQRIEMAGMHFKWAEGLVDLLKHVDVSGVTQLD